ncbi:MAG: hypothetical protein WEA04_01405 [Candidatus Andersenbacteria bacterium]
MEDSTRGALVLGAMGWTIISIAVFVLVILLYFSWIGSHLSASLLGRDGNQRGTTPAAEHLQKICVTARAQCAQRDQQMCEAYAAHCL